MHGYADLRGPLDAEARKALCFDVAMLIEAAQLEVNVRAPPPVRHHSVHKGLRRLRGCECVTLFLSFIFLHRARAQTRGSLAVAR